MRRLGFAVASLVLFSGASAYAQVTNVTADSGTQVVFSPPTVGTFLPPPPPVLPGAGTQTAPGGGSGVTYNSFVTGVEASSPTITFEAANTGSGGYVSTVSHTNVTIDFNNTTGQSVDFHSTITPAALGFYLADTNPGCVYTGCTETSSAFRLQDLAPSTGTSLGIVGFNFSISDGNADPGSSLYQLSGSLSLAHNADGFFVDDQLGSYGDGPFSPGYGARGSLVNFREDSPFGSLTELIYQWDETSIQLSLASGITQLVYSMTVYSQVTADCLGDTGSTCLIGFSGFGDPVGRGGGVSLTAFNRGTRFDHGSGDGSVINGLNFSPETFDRPQFANGILTFEASNVPEPATWISMILGFGLLGAALRRRRVLAPA